MAEDFALPKSSYGELAKMVQAYHSSDQRSKGEPVAVPDVAEAAAMHPSLLSRNNKFFHSVGLIQGGQRKTLTEAGRALGLALSHDDEAAVVEAWSRVVDESDFLDRVISAVRIRGGMDEQSLQTHIALTAGAAKSAQTRTGTAAVIQVLVAAGRLVDEQGTLRATMPAAPTGNAGTDVVAVRGETARQPQVAVGAVRLAGPRAPDVGSGNAAVTVNVNITVDRDNIDAAVRLVREVLGQPVGRDDDLT